MVRQRSSSVGGDPLAVDRNLIVPALRSGPATGEVRLPPGCNPWQDAQFFAYRAAPSFTNVAGEIFASDFATCAAGSSAHAETEKTIATRKMFKYGMSNER